MKKSILLLFILVGSSGLIFAQKTAPLPPIKSTPSSTSATTSVTSRVSDIQKWYAEIQAIGMKNCTSKTYTVDEPVGYDKNGKMVNMLFDQTIQRCNLNPTYTVFDGSFDGDHWAEFVKVYLKNGKIFFVFITEHTESYSYEKRYYCDEDEKIIRELRRNPNYEEGPEGTNSEIRTNLSEDIRTVIDFDRFNRIQR